MTVDKTNEEIEDMFLGWIHGSVSPYSFLIEYFYGDCEINDEAARRGHLYKWMLAAFTEGWHCGKNFTNKQHGKSV